MSRQVPGGTVLNEIRADIGGFKKFILRGNAVDLAVGVVIGAAFGSVVQAIVKDILNPLIAALGGQVAAPSGADIADHAARVLADRLTGSGGARG